MSLRWAFRARDMAEQDLFRALENAQAFFRSALKDPALTLQDARVEQAVVTLNFTGYRVTVPFGVLDAPTTALQEWWAEEQAKAAREQARQAEEFARWQLQTLRALLDRRSAELEKSRTELAETELRFKERFGRAP